MPSAAPIDLFLQDFGCNSGESDLVQYLKFGLQLCYLLPFGFLYASFLMTIVRKKSNKDVFEDSFFTLHLVDGIITLYFLISDTCFYRLTSYVRPMCEFFVPLLKDPAYTLTPFLTMYLYTQLGKMLSTVAMSLNRYTSVNYPMHHKMFWLQHCNKVIIAILIIPLFFVWPVAIGTTSFLPFDGNSIINYERVVPWARTTYGRLIVSVPTLFFTIVSSMITSSKLRKLGKHMKKVEFSMNIATAFTASGFLLVTILQIAYLGSSSAFLSNKKWLVQLTMAATQIANDFYMLSGPVVLLILDKRMRSSLCCRIRKHSDSRGMTDPNLANSILRNSTSCDPGEPNTSQYIKFGLQLLYVLPFGFLYFSFLLTIIRKKKDRDLFGDSFFTLHLVDGFVSLFFLFLDVAFLRLTSYIRPVCEYLLPILKDPGYFLTPYFTLYLYVQLAKMLSTLAMNINRYTAVNNPIKHKIIWMNCCSKIIIAIFIIPVCFVWPVAIAPTSFLPLHGQAVIVYYHRFSWARTTYARMMIAAVTLVFTVFSSIITSSKLRKLGKHMKNVEFSMTVATLFTSAGFILLLTMQVVSHAQSHAQRGFFGDPALG